VSLPEHLLLLDVREHELPQDAAQVRLERTDEQEGLRPVEGVSDVVSSDARGYGGSHVLESG
jgi:hypothetical protein